MPADCMTRSTWKYEMSAQSAIACDRIAYDIESQVPVAPHRLVWSLETEAQPSGKRSNMLIMNYVARHNRSFIQYSVLFRHMVARLF